MKKGKKKLVISLAVLLIILVAIPAVFLINASINLYQPKEVVSLGAFGSTANDSIGSEPLVIFTWNIGHCGLGKEMDNIEDGGKQVMPGQAQYNDYKNGIFNTLTSLGEPSFFFLQEVDKNSKRSFNENQFKGLMEKMPGYSFFFAPARKTGYVPYPMLNPLGKVESGIVTMSRYKVSEALRYAYPTDSDWPSELFKPSPCFLLTRVPTRYGKELVLINTQNSRAGNASDVWKQEIVLLKQTIEKEYKAGNYVIVGGDWRQTPAKLNSKLFNDGNIADGIHSALPDDFLPQGWQWAYDSIRSTARDMAAPYVKGTTPVTITDFFVVSPNISIEAVRTVENEFKLSNHQAVAAKFSLKQE